MIAPEEIETMFEPFRRLGPARIGPDSGQHGLGLSIVRAVAEAHHAEVDARPRAGGGLTSRSRSRRRAGVAERGLENAGASSPGVKQTASTQSSSLTPSSSTPSVWRSCAISS